MYCSHNSMICTAHTVLFGEHIKQKDIGACSTNGRDEKLILVLVGNPTGKRPLGRHRRRWDDNIRMDLQELGYRGMDWIDLARDRDR